MTGLAAPQPSRPAWAGRLWRSNVWHKKSASAYESSLAPHCCQLTSSSHTPDPAQTTGTHPDSSGHSSGRATIAITSLTLWTNGTISLFNFLQTQAKKITMFNHVHPICFTLCLVSILYHPFRWLTLKIVMLVCQSSLSCIVQQSYRKKIN